jgi:alanine racemase
MRPSRVEIDLSRFERNLKEAIKNSKEKLIMAVVKADAYGHGSIAISSKAQAIGIKWLGVGIVEEGIELRNAGITCNIQILSQELDDRVEEIIKYNLIPTVCSRSFLFALSREGKRLKKNVPIFVKVDTGMGRYGLLPEEFIYFLKTARSCDNIEILGAMSHLPSADSDEDFTMNQMKTFKELIDTAKSIGIDLKINQIENSAGFLYFNTPHFNMIRLGLIIYGIPVKKGERINYQPVMSVKSRISFIKTIPKGFSISYSRTFISKRPMKVAVVPIGYADGYDRHLSNKGYMFVKGKKCPIIGNVTMDGTMIDVTDVKDVSIGDEVEIIGENVSAWDLAEIIGTIPYEVVSRMGKRLPRIFKY